MTAFISRWAAGCAHLMICQTRGASYGRCERDGNSEPIVLPGSGVLLECKDNLWGKKVTEGGTKAGNSTADKDGVRWMKGEDKKGERDSGQTQKEGLASPALLRINEVWNSIWRFSSTGSGILILPELPQNLLKSSGNIYLRNAGKKENTCMCWMLLEVDSQRHPALSDEDEVNQKKMSWWWCSGPPSAAHLWRCVCNSQANAKVWWFVISSTFSAPGPLSLTAVNWHNQQIKTPCRCLSWCWCNINALTVWLWPACHQKYTHSKTSTYSFHLKVCPSFF